MTYIFLNDHQTQYSVRQMCQVLGVSRSGYYVWRRRQPSHRERWNQLLLTHIRAIYAASHQTYGSPRVHAELLAQGFVCNRKRVARLMRLAHLQARRSRRPRPVTTQVDQSRPVAPNRLNREFQATALNQKWVSDITYVPTDEGWLYLAVVMDLYSRRIIGWAMHETLADEHHTKLRFVAFQDLASRYRFAPFFALALAVGVGGAGANEVDVAGLLPATRAAMQRAVAMLSPQPEALLVDAVDLRSGMMSICFVLNESSVVCTPPAK